MSDAVATGRVPTEALAWDEFAALFKRTHRQGEHVAIVGQTGSGKSVLGTALCRIISTRKAQDGRPTRVVVLGTKPRDDTLSALGWPVIDRWPPGFGQEACIVWPRSRDPEKRAQYQRATFRPLLATIYQEGGQTLCIDEAAYFERPIPNGLGLATTMEEYWTSARSLKLTLIAATQRPRHVTRSMWSEPSWVFIFPPDDDDDLKRVAELSGAKERVMELVPALSSYEFVCIRRQRGRRKRIYISQVA